ncbi:MAG: D-alanine--D-alanine ligase [Chloracidobacterium sp.]|nr:D-alanine--D-alanine ligase [Chloracidobacterium sp.]MDW8218351.1 D-alanine--D-alanine ligase family protein [Acidobacteriota bacterium]
MLQRLTVGVIFGGRSSEHEVSLRSAATILAALDPKRYRAIPIGITRAGVWQTGAAASAMLQTGAGSPTPLAVSSTPAASPAQVLASLIGVLEELDVAIPVLHGTYGEDGTIQGLFEMLNLPYVGCGVLASAAGMDKIVMKQLFRQAGLPIVRFRWFSRHDWVTQGARLTDDVLRELGLPVFVKPANLGSSVGITRVDEPSGFRAAVELAARYDRRIIVEQGHEVREIEVSVLGNDQPEASLPGEIISGAAFYDYADKYSPDSQSQLVIPAPLSPEQSEEVRRLAVRAFQAIDAAGLARVDFFLLRRTNEIVVNEINTMPGFTRISMYPKLWEASGRPLTSVLDQLIELALARHTEKARLARGLTFETAATAQCDR